MRNTFAASDAVLSRDSEQINDEGTLLRHALIAALIGIFIVVSGCDKHTPTGETVGQKFGQKGDKVIDKTNTTVDTAQNKMKDVGTAAENAAKVVGDKVQEKAAKAGNIVEDSAITASIKADFLKDPRLSAIAIEVNTIKGVVTLKGEVSTDVDKTRAATIASSVAGVVKVTNSLNVKG